MKVAVTTENEKVFQHFGHCRYFTIAQMEDGKVVSKETVDAEGSGHSALGGFLKSHGVDVLICGGIGGGAKKVLEEAGIRLMPGVSGDTAVDQALADFGAGTLESNPDAGCSGHGHGEGHSCGDHDHGHSCGGHHSDGEHHCGHHDHS